MPQIPRLCLIAVLVTAVTLPVACEGTAPTPMPTPTPTATPTPISPERLLVQAGQRMAALETFAFRISHKGGGTPLAGGLGLVMEQAEGVVARPAGLKLEMVGQTGNAVIKLSLISQAGATYLTNPFTGKWQQVEAVVNPLSFFDPDQGIGGIMTSVELPVYIGQEELEDGAQAYHLRGRLPARALVSLLGAEPGGEEMLDADIWLEIDSLYLRKVTLRGRLTPTEDPGIVRTILLFDFNEPVSITPPD